MEIPFATVERIANYLRCLRHLQEMGVKRVSSKELADFTKATPEQVRKDLSYFGRFGKTGTGYSVPLLARKLDGILRKRRVWKVCIIGAGSLGTALANYRVFSEIGYEVVALFDEDPGKVGKTAAGKKIYSIDEFKSRVESMGIDIAILTVPERSLEQVEKLIASSKIRGVMNFVPHTINIKTRRKVAILDIDLAKKMYILSYLIKNKKEEV